MSANMQSYAESGHTFIEDDNFEVIQPDGDVAIVRVFHKQQPPTDVLVSKDEFSPFDQQHLHQLRPGMRLYRGNGYFYAPDIPRKPAASVH